MDLQQYHGFSGVRQHGSSIKQRSGRWSGRVPNLTEAERKLLPKELRSQQSLGTNAYRSPIEAARALDRLVGLHARVQGEKQRALPVPRDMQFTC